MSPHRNPSQRNLRYPLRAKLVRTAIGTLSLVTVTLILTVVALNAVSARHTLERVESDIRESIVRKGQNLAMHHARALRGLVADNAFGDVRRLVEATVHDDEDLAYGLFLGADLKPWVYSSRNTPSGAAEPDPWQELDLDRSVMREQQPRTQERRLFGQGVFQFSAPVRDEAGDNLGVIVFGSWRAPLDRALDRARRDSRRSLLMSVGLLSGLTLASIMIGWFLVRRAAAHITSPLAQLTEATAALAAGDRTLRVSISSEDELEQLGVAFNQMVEELNESYVRLEGLNRTLEERVEVRTRELAGRNRDLRLVLDTVNEGLMTVDLEGRLAQEHSATIDRWFGPYSGATLLSDYLKAVDENFALFFQLAYEALRDDVLPFEVNIQQFPSRLRHQERVFQFSYLPMFEAEQLSGLLVTVNDITAELALTRHEAEQRELLAIFEGLMRDRQLFLSFFDEASELVEGIGAPEVSLEVMRRLVHTLKGNASLVSLNVVAEICHDIEDQIEQSQGTGADPTAKILVLRERWRMLDQSLRSFLGERGRSTVEVEVGDIERLVDDLSRGAKVGDLAIRVAAWRCAPASRLFARLADHARLLANRLDRGDLIVEIDSDGVLIDPQRWAPLWAELIHLVRNAVDHGLEPSAQRAPLGKPVRPRLRLGAHLRPEGFLVEVEDDGKGLDWEAIRRAARRRGLPADSEADLLNALFTGGVSTRADVTTTSGRGVGLAALHRRVQELGGHITVSSRPWLGTCWGLQFPSSSLAAHEGIGSGPEAPPLVGKVASA